MLEHIDAADIFAPQATHLAEKTHDVAAREFVLAALADVERLPKGKDVATAGLMRRREDGALGRNGELRSGIPDVLLRTHDVQDAPLLIPAGSAPIAMGADVVGLW